MLTSSGSTGGGGDAKTIISPNTSFGDIITWLIHHINDRGYPPCGAHTTHPLGTYPRQPAHPLRTHTTDLPKAVRSPSRRSLTCVGVLRTYPRQPAHQVVDH